MGLKITKTQLRKLIQEEVADILSGPTRKDPTDARPPSHDPLSGPTAKAPEESGDKKMALIVKELEVLINKIKKAI